MELYDWNRIEKEEMNPVVARQVIHTEKLTVAKIFLKKGAVVAEHSHPNEQLTMLEQGKLAFTVEGRTEILSPGQALRTPPNSRHTVKAIEDCVAMDVFCPPREDWIRGDDAYLRK